MMRMISAGAAAALLLCGPAFAQDMGAPAPGTQPDPNAQAAPDPLPPGTAAMQPAPQGVTPDPSAPQGSPANPVVVGGNMTPPPPAPRDNYPLCSRTLKDSCMNPSEAPKGHMRHKRH